MITVIAGGRDYVLDKDDWDFLDALNITEILSGCADGVDTSGELYGEAKGIPVEPYPADWTANGKAAGPIRNREMGEDAELVVLFRGGVGTKNMQGEAQRRGVILIER